MDDTPVLLPRDPQGRLSPEARRQIQRAHLRADAIRWEAEVEIETRSLSSNQPTAAAIRKRANLKAARYVLQVLSREYGELVLSLTEFRECMRDEIEGAANSLGLSNAERQLLQMEFALPPEKPRSEGDRPAPSTGQPRPALLTVPLPIKSETIGAQIERLRDECDLSIEELAEKVGLDPTNVSRHIRGESNPNRRNRHKYQRVFSILLNRQIVISKTQLKRS